MSLELDSGNKARVKKRHVQHYWLEPIRIFVSYSSSDRWLAAKLSNEMRGLLVDVFLAHDDIEGGTPWRERLRAELEGCDMLIALITPNFHKSEYTEQEVGAAWILKKPVLSVCTSGEVPHGFISEIQKEKYDTEEYKTASRILKFALSYKYDKESPIDELIEILHVSSSFAISNCLVDLLTRMKPFTTEQIKNIISAGDENIQVRGAFHYRDLKRQLALMQTQ